MHPNSALDQDSRLRKSIRSMGLKIARIISEVKTIQGVQLVDVFDGESGSDYKDVPILRPTSDFVSLPGGVQELSNTDVLKNGTSVLLGFLEGSRSPVVLGVVNSGAGGIFKQIISEEARTGDKKVDNGLPVPFDGDAVYGSQKVASTIIIRSDDGDIGLYVFDVPLVEINNAKTPAERNAIFEEAILRNPNFDIFLFGMESAVRILKVTNANVIPTNDFERVLNARYWGAYKNLIEYPYIASLAARIQNIEDLLDALGTVMNIFKAVFSNPADLVTQAPNAVEGIETLMDLLTGTKKPQTVRRQLAFGADRDLGPASLQILREAGGDTFLPLVVYEAIGNILKIHNPILTNSKEDKDINRPIGFGGSNQLNQLFPDGFPGAKSFDSIIAEAMGEIPVTIEGVPVKIKDSEIAKNAVASVLNTAGLNVPLSDTEPGVAGPNKWESLMSPLIKLSVHLPEE